MTYVEEPFGIKRKTYILICYLSKHFQIATFDKVQKNILYI